jgi:hypothetical protein
VSAEEQCRSGSHPRQTFIPSALAREYLPIAIGGASRPPLARRNLTGGGIVAGSRLRSAVLSLGQLPSPVAMGEGLGMRVSAERQQPCYQPIPTLSGRNGTGYPLAGGAGDEGRCRASARVSIDVPLPENPKPVRKKTKLVALQHAR